MLDLYDPLLSCLQEWGDSCPHLFMGAYRLEADQSWTPTEHIAERSQRNDMVDKLLSGRLALASNI